MLLINRIALIIFISKTCWGGSSAPMVKLLGLRSSQKISSKVLETFVRNTPLITSRDESLVTLDLAFREWATDDYVIASVKEFVEKRKMPPERIKLVGCYQITDVSISYITKRCPLLSYLDIRHCSRVTDASICEVASLCHWLTHLHLAYCREITNVALQSLLEQCSFLTQIDIRDCRRISQSMITTLLARGITVLR